ncbi:prepilin-type N-terminal cleavage/methylation domain-containing protein [candidate division WOR-3 bacterium]|nr:prepilin-type N-terminal cleavage/methylation domain-containing protein [candidate division WOR-3 bacterium]
MTTPIHRQDRGVTLLELLVVLMILSIVLTAAVRTWDVTLERGRAQTTAQKLDRLVQVIVGDPDYIVAGSRADFGFIGDEGRLPNSLQELVVRPPAPDSVWRGPYIRSTFNQSVDGYRMDGWGDTIVYGYERYKVPESLWVRSYGGRGVVDRSRWQTVLFPYSYAALVQNEVHGRIVDVRGNDAPTSVYDKLRVRFYYPKGGFMYIDERNEEGAARFDYFGIPQGTHRLVALYYYALPSPDSVFAIQEVPVYPGVGANDVVLRIPKEWPLGP